MAAMGRLSKLSDRFTETKSGDEIIVMRLDTGAFLSLTGTAASAWSLIDGTRDRDALISALATEYVVNRGQIADDVDEFLTHLMEIGLLGDE
jgi:hypothetical protein